MKPVVLFYVQHLLGIGHLRRAALIARAIQAAGLELRFVSGGAPAGEIDIGAGELIPRPPAVADKQAMSVPSFKVEKKPGLVRIRFDETNLPKDVVEDFMSRVRDVCSSFGVKS